MARLAARWLRVLAERIDPNPPQLVTINLPTVHLDGKELARAVTRAVVTRRNGGLG